MVTKLSTLTQVIIPKQHQHLTNNQRKILVMETNLPKRVSINIETKVVGIIYDKIIIKYFIKETILVGEY